MKIGELAARANLNASAIRYYEKLGLLAAPQRLGGQRRYSSDALSRVLLIRFATDMGFSASARISVLSPASPSSRPAKRACFFANVLDREARLPPKTIDCGLVQGNAKCILSKRRLVLGRRPCRTDRFHQRGRRGVWNTVDCRPVLPRRVMNNDPATHVQPHARPQDLHC